MSRTPQLGDPLSFHSGHARLLSSGLPHSRPHSHLLGGPLWGGPSPPTRPAGTPVQAAPSRGPGCWSSSREGESQDRFVPQGLPRAWRGAQDVLNKCVRERQLQFHAKHSDYEGFGEGRTGPGTRHPAPPQTVQLEASQPLPASAPPAMQGEAASVLSGPGRILAAKGPGTTWAVPLPAWRA